MKVAAAMGTRAAEALALALAAALATAKRKRSTRGENRLAVVASQLPFPVLGQLPQVAGSCTFKQNITVGCKRAVRNQDFGFHFTFRPQVFFRPQILALSPLKESQQRRNQDHSKALALKIEIDMPYALFEPREAYPREKSIFVHVSLTGSCTGFQLTCCALLGTVKC